MRYLKKFNEDVTDGNVIEPGMSNIDNPIDDGIDLDDQFSIFNDIDGDIDNMDPADAKDYLKSIIVFCNQKINDILFNSPFFHGKHS